MLQQVRRIVTANDAEGRSRILSDGPSPHVLETAPQRGLTDLWAMFDGGPDTRTEDGADRPVVLSPAPGGNTFRFFQLPPRNSEPAGKTHSSDVFAKMGATGAHRGDDANPNMHRTVSIDYIVLLSGRVRLTLDEGSTDLKPFDVVIQRETNHAWENLTDEPALMLAVLIDTSTQV